MSYVQMHGVLPRQGFDRFVLAAAILLGCAGTAALKVWDAPIILTAAYPIGVLLLYVMACMMTRTAALEPDTVGDNCYYLGFLLTLSSLAVTLYKIRNLNSIEGATLATDMIPQVISGFGVALSSTIVGVALRVWLMQMRPDVVARDREARRDLLKAVREFHTTLSQASRRMKEFAIENSQYAVERNGKIDELTDRHGTQIKELTDQHGTQINELVSQQVKAFEALAQSAALGVDRQTAQMSELLTRQSKAFEAAIHATVANMSDAIIAKIEGETLRAASTLNEATEQLASMIGRVAQAQEDGLPRLREAQKGVEMALDGWRNSIIDQRSTSQEASQALTDQTAALAGSAQAHRQAFDDASKALAEEVASVASVLEAQRQVTLRANDDLARQAAAMTSSAEAQRAATQEAMQRISEQTGSLAAAAEMVIEVVEGAAQRIEKAANARAEAERAAAERAEAQRAEAERSRAGRRSRWFSWGSRSGSRA